LEGIAVNRFRTTVHVSIKHEKSTKAGISDRGPRLRIRISLTIWRDADPDIPIYKQAKAEYAKLQ
jgi:hypothetical protein